MPKEEWGVKRICPTTGKRFYDLNKSPVVSPYTGEAIVIDGSAKSRVLVADKDDPAKAKKEDDLLLDDDDIEEDIDVEEEDADVLDDDAEDDGTVSINEIGDVADGNDDD